MTDTKTRSAGWWTVLFLAWIAAINSAFYFQFRGQIVLRFPSVARWITRVF
ncbi:MAG: hypothetical protein ACRD16_00395 [Thermoanaerobaculia bacterium]